jgi:hypothetical protein
MVRHAPTKTNPQTPVKTFAIAVWGHAINTGSQTTVIANETNKRIKTHLRGRDAGFKERQILPRSNMLMDTETDTNARSKRKLPTATLAASMRGIMAVLAVAVENRPLHVLTAGQ